MSTGGSGGNSTLAGSAVPSWTGADGVGREDGQQTHASSRASPGASSQRQARRTQPAFADPATSALTDLVEFRLTLPDSDRDFMRVTLAAALVV